MSFTRLPDKLAARVAAFSLVGVANGIVGIVVIVVASLSGAGPLLANLLGYGAGLLVSFTLNSRVTFHSRAVDSYTVARFLVAFGVAFAIDLLVVKIVSDLFTTSRLLASLSGTPLYVVNFYLLCEYWVFRRNPKDANWN
jgi:putative flippase GtrA